MAEAVAEPSAPELLAEARERTDRRLEEWADRLRGEVGGREGEAFAYALSTPGKRVRPALLIAAYRAAGGREEAIAGVAAAVETVHTYSLVHDDLPCMDDDDLRRGRPTTHRVFGERRAILAGTALIALAFRVACAACNHLALYGVKCNALLHALADGVGAAGMVGGQVLDLEAEQ